MQGRLLSERFFNWTLPAGVAKPGQRRENSTIPMTVENAKLRTSSRRGSWVQIPPPAPVTTVLVITSFGNLSHHDNRVTQFANPVPSLTNFGCFGDTAHSKQGQE